MLRYELTSEQLPEDLATHDPFMTRIMLLVYFTGLVTTPVLYMLWLVFWHLVHHASAL